MNTDTEEKLQAALWRLFDDPQPVQIHATKMDLWLPLCAVQLALRHPGFACRPSAAMLRQMADSLIKPLIANDRDLALLWAMGNEQRFDDVAPNPCSSVPSVSSAVETEKKGNP